MLRPNLSKLRAYAKMEWNTYISHHSHPQGSVAEFSEEDREYFNGDSFLIEKYLDLLKHGKELKATCFSHYFYVVTPERCVDWMGRMKEVVSVVGDLSLGHETRSQTWRTAVR